MRLRSLSLVVLIVAYGCRAHEKTGDGAAAVGDWRTAVREYRAALSTTPESLQLQEKYKNAQEQARGQALKKANGCVAIENWVCTISEAEFALELDPGNPEILRLRATATRARAEQILEEGRAALARGDVLAGFAAVHAAQRVDGGGETHAGASRLHAELIVSAENQVENYRRAEAYSQAFALLKQLVREDPSKAGLLETVKGELEAQRVARYEIFALEGDAAFAARDWPTAVAKYEAAENVRPGGRGAGLGRYARAMWDAESALAAGQFSRAAAAYRAAVKTGHDDGTAAAQLKRVEIRPYSVHIRSVLAKPVRPDGQPWVGPPNPLLGNILKATVAATTGGLGAVAATVAIDSVMKVPPENRPTLIVQTTLPDEQRLATPARRGLYITYESRVVIETNHFDERRLSFRVRHDDGRRSDDVGVVDVALGELVSAGGLSLSAQSIAALELVAEPEEALSDGMFAGLLPIGTGNEAPTFSMPGPNKTGFKLAKVQAAAVLGDYQDEFKMDGPPDLIVEIRQRGQVVYRSPLRQDSPRASWEPKNVWLWVEPNERLVVRLIDQDVSDDDIALEGVITPGRSRPPFILRTQRGSFVELTLLPRAGQWEPVRARR